MTVSMLVSGWIEASAVAALLSILLYWNGRRWMAPRWLHLAWSVVLLKMLLPPLVLIQILPILSNFNQVTSENPQGFSAAPDVLTQDYLNKDALQIKDSIQIEMNYVNNNQSILIPLEVQTPVQGDEDQSVATNLPHRNIIEMAKGHWSEIVIGIWSIGVLCSFFLAVRRVKNVMQIRNELQPVSSNDQNLLNNISDLMKLRSRRVPEMKLIGKSISPMVLSWGFFGRSLLILPEKLWQGWSEAEKRVVLAHELAHIKRGDDRFAWLGLILKTFQWHNPLAHWAHGQWKQAEENAADEMALVVLGGGIENRRDLANTILQTVESLNWKSKSRLQAFFTIQMTSTLTSAKELKNRINMIGKFSMIKYESRCQKGIAFSIVFLLILPIGIATSSPGNIMEPVEAIESNTGDSIEHTHDINQPFDTGSDLSIALNSQLQSLNQREAALKLKISRTEKSIREYPALAEELSIALDQFNLQMVRLISEKINLERQMQPLNLKEVSDYNLGSSLKAQSPQSNENPVKSDDHFVTGIETQVQGHLLPENRLLNLEKKLEFIEQELKAIAQLKSTNNNWKKAR